MANFVLIAEGKTDHAVLHNILIGKYGVDVEVKPIQPLYDATDRSRDSLGGWEQVFQYCQHENFDEIFEYNDYAIIHIDTDAGEEVNFGVSLYQDGDRPVNDLVFDVRRKISVYFCYCRTFAGVLAIAFIREGKSPFYQDQ